MHCNKIVDIRLELGVELLRRNEPAEVAWASDPDFGDVSGTSKLETSGKTQNLLEELYSPSSLGTPRKPPGGAGILFWVEGTPGVPC